MARKLPELEHVKYVKAKGKVYAYFNTGQKNHAGKPVYARLPHPSEIDFFDKYNAQRAVRTKRNQVAYTVAQLVEDYQNGRHFQKRPASTKKTYGMYLRRIEKAFKDFPATSLRKEHVKLYADKELGDAPGAYNLFLAVVAAVYSWGAKNGKLPTEPHAIEPTKYIDRMDIGTHEPWPDHLLEAGLSSDIPRIKLLVHILYFTGMRINDALKLRWSDVKDGYVAVTPTKTIRFGTSLDIKIAQDLAAVLDKTPRRGMTIVSQENGKPVGYAIALRDMKDFAKSKGFNVVPHGLRKNAVNSLLEAQCTVAEVSAITGQSFAMVEHYAKRMNRKAMGAGAIVKMEDMRKANGPK